MKHSKHGTFFDTQNSTPPYHKGVKQGPSVKGPIHYAIIACNFLQARCDIRHLTTASFEENRMKQKKVETDQLFFDSSNFLQKLTLFLEKLHAIHRFFYKNHFYKHQPANF